MQTIFLGYFSRARNILAVSSKLFEVGIKCIKVAASIHSVFSSNISLRALTYKNWGWTSLIDRTRWNEVWFTSVKNIFSTWSNFRLSKSRGTWAFLVFESQIEATEGKKSRPSLGNNGFGGQKLQILAHWWKQLLARTERSCDWLCCYAARNPLHRIGTFWSLEHVLFIKNVLSVNVPEQHYTSVGKLHHRKASSGNLITGFG